MPRKTPKYPDRVAAQAQQKERRLAQDRAAHSAQLAAVLDQVLPLPSGQSHFRDALPPAEDPSALAPLQLSAQRQLRAVDQAVDELAVTHRDMTLIDVALALKEEPLHTLVIAGLIRRVIELSGRLEQPKQAAEIRHADRRAAREWVCQEWLQRSADFTGARHFATSYASKVQAKFGIDVSVGTIRTTWIKRCS